ncbi:MAG TPA: hydrogenase maturation protease, partial [Nocardioidaceae bacterium]|nr:hydrogenase maturation protease [Nocardioidaceae bacterium]
MSGLVIGIGNRSRGDDAVGPEVASRVASLNLRGVTVVEHGGPLALVDQLGEHDDVVVVDATASHGEPGSVRVVRVGETPLKFDPAFTSSHGIGVAEAVELARSLGRLPRRLTLVGVEAADFEAGAPLSA